ncbi:nitroreductase/quinone reductase family protein [Nitriliruptor alkaliphilus]|uniref:nitroreductase/quinone reductase family protein n=1 Tax=Nitriliruptor alkaliphilus TaxID=427918 RepID=UPI0014700083|nr:nitroreductase/quinone reductase family protein [Nitriliruptor alkaliphilus]
MGVKLPQGNTLVLAILRSPLHRLLSGSAIELRYTGRRSGRQYAIPVQYARDGKLLVVAPQRADAKTWWRNFHNRQPVTIRLARQVQDATAEVIERHDSRWERDRELYTSRWRRLVGRLDGPLVEIALLATDTNERRRGDATP